MKTAQIIGFSLLFAFSVANSKPLERQITGLIQIRPIHLTLDKQAKFLLKFSFTNDSSPVKYPFKSIGCKCVESYTPATLNVSSHEWINSYDQNVLHNFRQTGRVVMQLFDDQTIDRNDKNEIFIGGNSFVVDEVLKRKKNGTVMNFELKDTANSIVGQLGVLMTFNHKKMFKSY